MTSEEMWKQFIETNNLPKDTPYEAWQYGDVTDKLAELTLKGIKTATASAHPMYVIENEDLPAVGLYNIILDSHNQAVCIVVTAKVYTTPFNQVSPEHAFKEGEGDRSLDHWRKAHQAFFSEELASVGLTFSEDMLIVCEEFEVVFPVAH